MEHGQHRHAHPIHACCGGAIPPAQHAIDPVCGMKVDPKSAAGSHEHGGVTYHFCSKHCLAAFKADPAKFLAKAAPVEVQAVLGGTQYTCPMHPEILRD